MSGQGRERRKRAVHLTDDALEILQRRLHHVWKNVGQDERMTGHSRASMMGVSVSTASRVLSQDGNDRAVLVHIFENLGLEWDNRYCEASSCDADSTPLADHSPMPDEGRPTLPRDRRIPLIALAAAMILSIPGLLWWSARNQPSASVQQEPARQPSVTTTLDASRAAYQRADYETAAKFVHESFLVAKTNSIADKLADSLSLEGDVLAAKGRLEEAVDRYKKALPLWDVLEKAHGRASLLESLGIAEARLGRLDEAESHFKEALKSRKEVNDPGVTAGLLRDLGSVAAVSGDLRAAQKWYAQAIMELKGRPDEPMLTDIEALSALLLRDQGKYGEALKMLQGCLNEWKERGHARWVATTLFQIATVHAGAGHRELARQTVREAKHYFEKVGDGRGTLECTKWLEQGLIAADFARRLEEYF